MIRVGPAGWSYADWEGIVYPRPKPRGFHGLAYLAQFFSCIEINSSFYAMPRAEHAERWVELVEDRPDFRFLSKLNGEFTHGKGLDQQTFSRAVQTFRQGIEPLVSSGKFGALLMQFPISFRDTPLNRSSLDRLVQTWGDLPLALELRHSSWFEREHYDWLSSHGASLLQIDLPAAPDHPPADVPSTGKLGYYRLHGRNRSTWFDRDAGRDQRYDYLYPPSEVDELVARTKLLASRNDETYVVTNNHFEGQAVANGLEIQAALNGGPVRIPEGLVERYPHLRTIAKPQGQQRLF